ncbi:MAG TPA: cadherin-like domain-containing protein, partial [Burkholderiales bacterium]|nr:cadherin-like domain-containing protein [Burkholderiales bacterium]
LAGGLVQFVDDGNEVAPAFSVKVNDGALDSNTLAATITYTPVNDAPVLTGAALTLTEGQIVTLSAANFGITDADNAAFTYIASAVSGGFFQLSTAAGTPVTTFTSAELAGGLVQFVDDGNEIAPAFSVKVNDGTVDSNTLAATVTYTTVNDAPVVAGASLTVNEGQTVTLNGASFAVTDADSTAFTYTISGIAGGFFQLSSAAGTPITTFTGADLAANAVQFVHDGTETPAAFSVTVSDGSASSNTLAATIAYTPLNDAPIATNATLTLTEGQTVTLTPASFGVTDPDNAAFTYTVSTVTGGYFQLLTAPGVPVTTFTSAALAGGVVQFVDDGDEVAPSFSVKVSDGAVDSNTLAAVINYSAVNDVPVLLNVSLTVAEGGTATLAGSDFGITDPDSAAFTYTVSAVTGGYFQLTTAPGVPVTTFTSADLAANRVQFVDDGDESAPTLAVTVSDGTASSNTLAATVAYTPVNDAPAGTAVIAGSAREDQTLTADASALTDAEGVGALAYQWDRSIDAGASWSAIAGATAASYALSDVDVGSVLRVTVSYLDGRGTPESITSVATAVIENVNDAPVGSNTTVTASSTTYVFTLADFALSDPVDGSTSAGADQLSGVQFATLPAAGSLTLAGAAVTAGEWIVAPDIAAGKLVYTGIATETGNSASFGFHVRDSGGTANGGIDTDPVTRIMTVTVPASLPDPLQSADRNLLLPIVAPTTRADDQTVQTQPETTRKEESRDEKDSRAARIAPLIPTEPVASPLAVGATSAEAAVSAPQTVRVAANASDAVRRLSAWSAPAATYVQETIDTGLDLQQRALGPLASLEIPAGARLQAVAAPPVGDTQDSGEGRSIVTIESTVKFTGAMISAGAVAWALRGAGLLTSLLATVPAWRHLDPVPVLAPEEEKPDWGDGDDANAGEERAVSNLLRGADATPRT